MPAAASPTRRGRRSKQSGWRKPTGIQIGSHVATFYSIGCFAAVLQPSWLSSDDTLGPFWVVLYWAVFFVSLALYAYVCSADTRYREANDGFSRSTDYEARRCEDCSPNITRFRVKHCQTCGKCTEDFDHHCRYLNVCVGGRTYVAWFCFVVGLFILIASAGWSAIQALARPEHYKLVAQSSPMFYTLVGAQAVVSCLLCVFLISLLAQHSYFVCLGITTLEYVKDQDPGFPALPPRGWREAVQMGECYLCNAELELVELEDQNDVWFCTVCQVDIAKAGVDFFTCERCEKVTVCPLCKSAAHDPAALVVTYKVASLRKRAEAQANGVKGFEAGYGSRYSSFSSHQGHQPRKARRNLTAVVAAVEGHTGDPVRRCGICSSEPSGTTAIPPNEEQASSSSGSDESNGDF